jgi:hypothetical protein
MSYDAPGHADELSDELIERWNNVIAATAESLASFQTRFFELDPTRLRDPELSDAVKWPGDPAAPTFCVDRQTVRALCDWPEIGRRSVQLEYCECVVLNARDSSGRLRPKRVEVTTELREYWSCVAMYDPEQVRVMAVDVLGREPDWEELFGVADPHALSPKQREIAFGHTIGGHGNDQRLIDAGVPAQPSGRLNIDRALFMTHPINGLDDFFYVVMFGSHPYGVREGSQILQATGDDIYTAKNVKHLSCNHADPTITLGAYDNAFAGRQTGFANPLGMYIRMPNLDTFFYGDDPIPQEWARFGRGREGLFQRLVFGPPDDHEAFLDDIIVSVGASDQPVTGGYQLLRELEIGLRLLVGHTTPIAESEWELLEPAAAPISCDADEACATVRELARRLAAEQSGHSALRTL